MAEIRRIADGEGETVAALTPQARGRGTSSALATAVVAELRARGTGVIHNLVCIEDDQAQAFWQTHGFERDMVCLSLYERS